MKLLREMQPILFFSILNMSDVKTISIESKNYPRLLKKIKDAPKILYIKGEVLPEENCFAMVGTRRFSSYGKQVALEIAGDLTETGLTIVSGLAPGIDTFCHQAVVERKQRTIAVLGTGLDKKSIYPQSNLKLTEEILKNNGCLISEYPNGTSGAKFTFPARNRIISGLCIGTLVIEAKMKSGSLITAEWAKKQNRKIFAVPGSVYSSNSKGCHYLIKKGVKLVEDVDDILKELDLPKTTRRNIIEGENQEESLILKALKEESLNIDKIIEKTNLPVSIVASSLAIMEINNKVKNLGGNIYAINKGAMRNV